MEQADFRSPNAASLPSTLSHKAIRAVAWTYASYAGSKVLAFASVVFLARLLAPSEFGQFGFALLVISYLDTVGDFGVSAALIYERKRWEQAANIAFAISLISGGLWFALATLLAPQVALFFKDPSAEPLLRVLAWVFLITALGNTHDALLRRELSFGKRVIPDFVRAFLKGLCSILLAALGWGVWSLVWGQLLGALAATVALWVVMPWRPQLQSAPGLTRRMLRYGGQIVSVNVLSSIVHHVDYLIVGRMLGSAALGYYTLAYRIPEFLINCIIWSTGMVAFPAFAQLQDDFDKLRSSFLATVRYISLLTLPIGIVLALLARMIIPVFFGEKWIPSIPVLQALAISTSLRSIGSHSGDIFTATGRPQILVKLNLLQAVIFIPGLIWAAQFGIVGVAVTQIILCGAGALLTLYVDSRLLSVAAKDFISAFRPAVLSSIALGLGLYLILPLMSALPRMAGLLLTAGLAFGIYATTTWMVSKDTVQRAQIEIAAAFGMRR